MELVPGKIWDTGLPTIQYQAMAWLIHERLDPISAWADMESSRGLSQSIWDFCGFCPMGWCGMVVG